MARRAERQCCAGAFVVLLVLGQFGSVGLAGNSSPGPRREPASRAELEHAGDQPHRRRVEFC